MAGPAMLDVMEEKSGAATFGSASMLQPHNGFGQTATVCSFCRGVTTLCPRDNIGRDDAAPGRPTRMKRMAARERIPARFLTGGNGVKAA